MTQQVTVGLGQWLPEPGRPAANLEAALAQVAALAGRGAEFVVLPELWPCGYRPATLAADAAGAAEPLDGRRGQALSAAAAAAGVWLVAGSVPEAANGHLYNTAPVYDPRGELVAAHRKCRLYRPTGEDGIFAAGSALTTFQHPDLGTVGLVVCFDGDFPESARALRGAGARVVVLPSAYEFEAAGWWDTLYPANALANGQWWLMGNQCGSHDGATLLGASRLLTPFGEVAAEAARARPGVTPESETVLGVVDMRMVAAWDEECAVLVDDARPIEVAPA